jgi:hypothetical protein
LWTHKISVKLKSQTTRNRGSLPLGSGGVSVRIATEVSCPWDEISF